MKALILAAGLGTRLAPYTRDLPKPLFTLNNRTVLDLAIDQMAALGCDRIFINTHHLADQIQNHLDNHPRAELLEVVHEPRILDTGGAIANLKSRIQDDDFLVVNADIVHNLDLRPVIDRHRETKALATLVLHHCPEFNKITLGPENCILNFAAEGGPECLAFTGLQILSPKILGHLPDQEVFSSIDLYASLCSTGRIKGYPADNLFWQDMGTVQRYQETARQFLAGQILGLDANRYTELDVQLLAGDGSDRRWFRAAHKDRTIVISDHGICLDHTESRRQLDAFVRIGRHLDKQGVSVPWILGHDRISGQVAVQDLGATHLADMKDRLPIRALTDLYQTVIDELIRFSVQGMAGFDPAWTCQTPSYSKQMILDLECRYFLEAFVQGYLGIEASWEDLEPAFTCIADQARVQPGDGLMHRDFQSRNIMVHDRKIYFIDFQSARPGPLAYDLASLLIDPYVTLPGEVQESLLAYCISGLARKDGFDEKDFRRRYTFCAISRNLQMLGAFGFLTRIKKKQGFEPYIPPALAGLKQRLAPLAREPLTALADLVNHI